MEFENPWAFVSSFKGNILSPLQCEEFKAQAVCRRFKDEEGNEITAWVNASGAILVTKWKIVAWDKK